MLFLHGYLSSKEAFSRQINYFSKFYRVTAIDFLGFGKSGELKTPFSVDDYALWLNGKLTALGVVRPHVIAHSFGCRVAIKTASKDVGAFDKIILTGPAGVILRRPFSYHVKVKTYKIVKRFAPRFAEKKFGSKEYRLLSPVMRESYKKIVNEDLRDCAKTVRNNVLIIQGDKDKTTPLKEALAYVRAFPNAKIKEINGGHFAFLDDPTAFNLLVEEFLYDASNHTYYR